MLRKLAIAVPLIFATAAVLWSGLSLPPPLWIVKYGPWPGCEPTGRVIMVEGVDFVGIGPGCSRMGSNAGAVQGDLAGRICAPLGLLWGKPGWASDEMPVHWVEFPVGFAIAKTEITNTQYRQFLRANPEVSRPWFWDLDPYNGPLQPVVGVRFAEAERYCAWLAERSGFPIRLPSESEWEASCRAGGTEEYSFGDDGERLGEFACFDGNSEGCPSDVAAKRPNAWGLYDLHGNVWEWCRDLWHDSYLVTAPRPPAVGQGATRVLISAPTGGEAWMVEAAPTSRVFRGGSWVFGAKLCRSAARDQERATYRWRDLGFRPALGPLGE